MSDRTTGFVVVLEQTMRSEDAAAIIAAVRQIRGVLDVNEVVDQPSAAYVAVTRERIEMANTLRNVVADLMGRR